MKEYSVQLSKPAQTYLSKLDRPTKERIVKSLRHLALDPYSELLDIKPLTGRPDQIRLRVGNYRIIYKVENDILIIYVIAIRPRGDVYK